jgi:histidine ammonia-lyase
MDSTEKHEVSSNHLSLKSLHQIYYSEQPVSLSADARARVQKCRKYLDEKMASQESPIYGINTGFGSLYNVSIEGKDLARLQENLVRSHACGTGEILEPSIVRLMLFLKAQSLSYGHSGATVALVEKLLVFYNQNLCPKVFQQGSLGASGDLAPLAHISLALMGEGEIYYEGEFHPAKAVLDKCGISPIKLKSKEGLALLNGTQFMLGIACKAYFEAQRLLYLSDLIAALSLDGYDGRLEPFDELIHLVRNHRGQISTAERIREFLMDSEIAQQSKTHVQDPYSFRCIPQVHGASKDLLSYVAQVLTGEVNAVTDNPTIFPDEDKIISGGNFHGQTLALALDSFALAMAEIGNISERRTYLLISGQRELPAFLVKKPGLNSGLMIAQYTAASIVSQNKQYCAPASTDSIVSSNGQEDHVSMGANAATKALKVLENLKTILAIELITASQALSFRKGYSSPFLESVLKMFREEVPIINEDRILSYDIEKARQFIDGLQVDEELIF